MGKEEMSERGKGEMEVEGEVEGGERGEQWGRVKETKWAREGEKASQAFSSQGSKGPTQENNWSNDPCSYPGAPRTWPGSCPKSPPVPPPCLQGQLKAP